MRLGLLLGSFALLLTVGCRTTSDSVSDAAIAYLRGLGSEPIGREFWDFAQGYNSQLSQRLSSIPKAMWPLRIDEVQRDWAAQITQARTTAFVEKYSPCWVSTRPAVQTQLLEIRAVGPPESTTQWKAFANLRYRDEASAPMWLRTGLPRRLRGLTIILSLALHDTDAGEVVRISDACELVQDSIELWPVPTLSTEEVTKLLQPLAKTFGSKSISLIVDPELWGQRIGEWDAFVSLAAKLTTFYHAHDFRIRKAFKISRGYWYTDAEVEPPADWGKCDLGDSSYALNESVDYRVVGVTQSDEQATAEVHMSYRGCTPACVFLRDLASEPELGPYVIASYTGGDWPREETVELGYQWDPIGGWTKTETQ